MAIDIGSQRGFIAVTDVFNSLFTGGTQLGSLMIPANLLTRQSHLVVPGGTGCSPAQRRCIKFIVGFDDSCCRTASGATGTTSAAVVWTDEAASSGGGLLVQVSGASGKIIGSMGRVSHGAGNATIVSGNAFSSAWSSSTGSISQVSIDTTGSLAFDFQVAMNAVTGNSIQLISGWIRIDG